VFDLISRFEVNHGCKASWLYFESDNGKSACDVVGGATKRNADNAVKQTPNVYDIDCCVVIIFEINDSMMECYL
jgi:hypothetical protein